MECRVRDLPEAQREMLKAYLLKVVRTDINSRRNPANKSNAGRKGPAKE